MKLQLRRVAAVTLAMSMCLPGMAFAEDEIERASASNAGEIKTAFDVYNPTISVSVPTSAAIKVNPLVSNTDTGEVKDFAVASNSIDVFNATVDEGNLIPLVVTVNATVTKAAAGVVQAYNDFTPDDASSVKKIHLELAEAATHASADGTTKASYDLSAAGANKAVITKWGSMLSVDVPAPASEGAVAVKSFAVVGKANTSADWKKDDISVKMTYKIKASKQLNVVTPTIATAPEVDQGDDLVVAVKGIGEAKVIAVGAHNDEAKYVDYLWSDTDTKKLYTVEYDTANAGTATVTIKGTDAGLNFLAGADYSGKPQDFIIALSDGRKVVTTLTVTKK